ncbi:exonuclease family protein [Tripterygium wilfordii]|uniref:Exonuclease family protein n=1 Tax=Tripterygium wilfordii TaxID=458696 RepID=A0A7J7BT69_TRIWF|nr:exonuclease family protein [Tripterygium wilfordii]
MLLLHPMHFLWLSDEEALSKGKKEAKNDRVQFVWTQFSELNSYFKRQAADTEKLYGKLAEMISLLTCHRKSGNGKGIKESISPELEEILSHIDAGVRCLYAALPVNAMLLICTGHGDTAIVHRLRKMLTEQSEPVIGREKIVKVLQEVQAQAEVALCFVGMKH